MNGGNWFVRQFGKVQGPFSWEQLRAMKGQGQLGSFSELSQDQRNWVSITRFPEFTPPPPLKRKPAPAPTPAPNPGSEGGTVMGVPAAGPQAGRPAAGQGPLEDLDPLPGSPAATRRPASRTVSNIPWYYALEDQQYGPVSLEHLQQMVERGELARTDMVWEQGAPEWLAVGDVPELGGGRTNPLMWLIPAGCLVLLIAAVVAAVMIWRQVND